jgi:hypothetical protein
MSESFEEYRARVLSYLGDRNPMRVLSNTPARLRRLTSGVSSRALAKRPAVGKWSIVEIVAHLADAELAIGWRFRNMIATPGVRLQWWDEQLWSEACHYSTIPVAASLELFGSLRSSNLRLLRSLSQKQLECCHGVHDKRGRQTVANFIRMEAAHDLNHLRQIAGILEQKPRRHDPGKRDQPAKNP